MTRFYTRTGDDGYTGLLGEGRVPKYHPQPEAVGEIDEASAALGLARATCHAAQISPLILSVQRDLYSLMAEVAALPAHAASFRRIDGEKVAWLEEQTDALSQLVVLPKDFIVPGDSAGGAALALARTVVRRAERRVAELLHQKLIENVEILRYLNRLSSLCFVLELLENQDEGTTNPTLAKDNSIP
jgi:cob(I)alamin adenosyltransferase